MIKAEQRQIVWMELYLAVVKCCVEDHLGSTTPITNKSGEVVQRVEYLPTGGHTSSNRTPAEDMSVSREQPRN